MKPMQVSNHRSTDPQIHRSTDPQIHARTVQEILKMDDRSETNARELIRLELALTVTFAKVAHTKYSMGNVAGGNVSRNNAEEAYRTALYYLEKVPHGAPAERKTLLDLVKKAEDAIATLREDTTGIGPT